MTAAAAAEPPLGLYVHLPFCEAKCSYCDFAIDPRRPDAEREARYLTALATEIEARGGDGPADTLYLGGGTPSLVSLAGLERLLARLRGSFPLAPDAELSLEANPRDLDAAGYRGLAALGFSRLSLGVQHLDDAVLAEMGRLHSAAEARRSFEQARAAGFASLSLDLILGWPGETLARWRSTLQAALALAPDHLSLYVLEPEGRTLLAHRARRGEVALPDDDLVAELYLETASRLAAAGLERYEISNFARPGHESRHNRKYWSDAPFLGFGMSAHSYRGGRRFWNERSFGGYCRAVEERGSALAGERLLQRRERAAEALFTGLRRREGVSRAAFRERYGLDPLEAWAGELADPLAAGLVELEGDTLRLTDKGAPLSNEVFRAFV